MKFKEWFAKRHGEENLIEDRCWYAETAWDACKSEVLKILEKPLRNLDLSEDYCDSRYIEQIKKL